MNQSGIDGLGALSGIAAFGVTIGALVLFIMFVLMPIFVYLICSRMKTLVHQNTRLIRLIESIDSRDAAREP